MAKEKELKEEVSKEPTAREKEIQLNQEKIGKKKAIKAERQKAITAKKKVIDEKANQITAKEKVVAEINTKNAAKRIYVEKLTLEDNKRIAKALNRSTELPKTEDS